MSEVTLSGIMAFLDDFSHYDTEDSDGYTEQEFIDMMDEEYRPRVGLQSRKVFHLAVGTDSDGYVVPEFMVLARNADSAMEVAVEYYQSHLWQHDIEDYETEDEYWDAQPEFSALQVVKEYSIDEWLNEFTEKIEGEDDGDEVLEQTEKVVDDTKLKDAESGIDKIEKVQKNTPEIKVENKKITISEFKKLLSEAPKVNYEELNKIEDKMRSEVLSAPVSVLKKVARDQGIAGEIIWKDPKTAAEEVWDIIFSPMFDAIPDLDGAKRMYASYFGKPFTMNE